MTEPTLEDASSRKRTIVIRVSLSTLLVVAALVFVLWQVGRVPNRQWHSTKEDSIQQYSTADGAVDYSICVVELDDQGVMWDHRQLDWTLEHLVRTTRASAADSIVFLFVHGWKQDASEHDDPSSRLALFRRDVERVAMRAAEDPGPDQKVVGIYLGWRGRSFSIPVLENLTFWNRRVAATRAASVDFLEVLLKIAGTAARDPRTKVVLMGHSLGGAIVERALAPALVVSGLQATTSARPLPVMFDLVVLANPASSALDAERLIGFFERNQIRLVTVGAGGSRVADGPLIASINAENDRVNRVSYPVGMWFNSLVLRYREDHLPGEPSQRRLATRAAGHEPSLVSHHARLGTEGAIELTAKGRATPGAPYWVIQVPDSISSGHSDVTGDALGRLLGDLMDRNRVFDPEVELALAGASDQ